MPPASSQPLNGAPYQASGDTPSHARVLIVEDERLVAADLAQTVTDLGYEACGTAATGVDALSRAHKSSPDIALMDIRIRGNLDGIETATRLRNEFGTSIIFLTAHADDQTIERSVSAQPFGYLVKPVSTPALRAAIELTRRRRDQEGWLHARDVAIAHANGQLSSALAHLHLAVLVESEDGRIVHLNKQFLNLFDVAEQLCPVGGDTSALQLHIEALCERPMLFRHTMKALRHARELATGDLVPLSDGRILERDFVPFAEQPHRGALWIYRDVTEREHSRQALEASSVRNRNAMLIDELTLLHNRRGFEAFAHAYLTFMRRGAESKVLFYVDLDGLKGINDQFGHAAGDEAIRTMAQVLRQTFRNSDLLARLGGDEFVVLASLDSASIGAVETRIHERLQALNATRRFPYALATSVGAAAHTPNESAEALMQRADTAMYRNKHARRMSTTRDIAKD